MKMKTILEVKVSMLESNFEEFSQILQNYNINEFDDNGDNILHYYIYHAKDLSFDYKKVIDLFLDKGISIDEKQSKGRFKASPLHISVSKNLKEISSYLIELGADVDSVDFNDNNILSTAVMWWKRIDDDYFIKKIN